MYVFGFATPSCKFLLSSNGAKFLSTNGNSNYEDVDEVGGGIHKNMDTKYTHTWSYIHTRMRIYKHTRQRVLFVQPIHGTQ